MKIRDRIKHLQKKTERWIEVCYDSAENHPESLGFFLEEADEFLEREILDRELKTERNYTMKGVKCIRLGFGER